MNKLWKWFLPGYILALPGTIVGLLMMVYYRPKSIKLRSGCIEAVVSGGRLIGGPWVGAQTFGNVIFYRDYRMQASTRLQVHERVHVWQAMVLSWPVFMLLYGLHFLVLLVTAPTWIDAYFGVWAERQAYRLESRRGVWGDADPEYAVLR